MSSFLQLVTSLVIAHVPIIGIDIWEHVRRYFPSRLTHGLYLIFQAFYLQVCAPLI